MSALNVMSALIGVVDIALRYSLQKGKVECERLYSLVGNGLQSFCHLATAAGTFQAGSPKLQTDEFYDIELNSRGILGQIDFYCRLRTVTANGAWKSGEVKVGFPGPRSAPNERPAEDIVFVQTADVLVWRNIFASLGLTLERSYEKTRTTLLSATPFGAHLVELEADEFALSNSPKINGALSGKTFVSLSVEISQESEIASAKAALDAAEAWFKVQGIELVPEDRNYEDIFYGRK